MAIKVVLLLLTVGLSGSVFGSPFGERNGNLPALLNVLEEKCIEKTGSDAGYIKIVTSLNPTLQCVMNRVNLKELQQDFLTITNDTRSAFFGKYCPGFTDSIACFDDLIDGVAMCQTDETADSLKTMFRGMLGNVIQLLCKDDGQYIFDARKPEYKECAKKLKEKAPSCKANIVILDNLGVGHCETIKSAESCLNEDMESCGRVMELIDALFAPLRQHYNCSKSMAELSNALDDDTSTD